MALSSFHEVRFPLAIAFGAIGGPERRTDIIQLASGAEQRTASWSGSRRRWDVGSAVQTLEELHDLTAFFEARRGALYGFRFRDFTDDRSCGPEQDPAPTDQALGIGDDGETEFQLVKHYGDYARPILKPVTGSVRIALDGVEQSSGFSVDNTTGVVTFSSAPGVGVAITAGFEFDCPARFDTDRLEASLEGFGAGRIVNAQLVELIG
ncbi:MAG: DUF2460 domain-containing protein [Hyphomonadaceae bacterium]|nr:DUF2460 domain-containing protein [Hyphomonadaceae bacterium]